MHMHPQFCFYANRIGGQQTFPEPPLKARVVQSSWSSSVSTQGPARQGGCSRVLQVWERRAPAAGGSRRAQSWSPAVSTASLALASLEGPGRRDVKRQPGLSSTAQLQGSARSDHPADPQCQTEDQGSCTTLALSQGVQNVCWPLIPCSQWCMCTKGGNNTQMLILRR